MKKLKHALTYSARVIIGLIAGLMIAVTSSAETLMVYTAVEAEDLKRYAAAFNEDHPDIKIRWVRDSTGIVTAKLLAEKNNPRADVIWGLAATSLMLMSELETFTFKTPDSAEVHLNTFIKEFSVHNLYPKAVYMLYYLYNSKGDSALIDSMGNILISQFPDTEFAEAVRKDI